MSRLASLLPDRFTLYLICTVIIASIVPAHGQGVVVFGWITNIAVGLLFFLHGARLSREAIIAGLTHWKLHLTIFSATFLMFPLLGLALKPVLEPLVTPELYLGILFLCCLPATVQSAIAFTSMARGNVPAAVCSASASSLLGIFLTPLLWAPWWPTRAARRSRSTPSARSCCSCCCLSCWASSRAAGSGPGSTSARPC
jgi:sodium/bile acid cotransporter 7